MPHWLLPSVIACMGSSAILCLIHAFLYRQYAQRFLRLWLVSWMLYTLRFTVQLLIIVYGDSKIMLIANQLCSVGSAYLLLWGVMEFVGRRPSLIWPAATLAISGWIVATISLGAPFLVIALPAFLFLGYAQIETGLTLLRVSDAGPFAGRLAGFALIAWGVHKLNYPFLRHVEWFAPWGFLLGSMLGLLTAMGILLMYFERMRHAMAQSTRLHRCLAENYPNGAVYLFDKNLRYILADGTAFPDAGLTKAMVEGQTLDTVFPGNNLEQLRTAYRNTLDGKSAVFQLEFNGRIRETRTRPVRDETGEIIWGMAISHDVTERLRTEEALRESEARYRSIFNNILDGYYRTDLNGHLLLFNPSVQNMLGFDNANELRNMPIVPAFFVNPQDWDDAVGLLLLHGSMQTFHTTLRRKNGEQFDAEASGRLIRDRYTGKPVAIEGVLRDISSRMNAERELLRAKEAAESANLSKTQFLANMSHEVRTPLNGVLGMLQLLGLTSLNETQRHYVELALASGKGLLTLLDDVLNLAKIEAGGAKVVTTSFSPAWVTETVVRLFQPEADAKGLCLSLSIAPEARRPLLGDEGRVRQILFNLLGNAIKFTESGGVAVTVSPLPLPPPGGGIYLLFVVEDSGIGIAPDSMTHVFEPFAQADGSFTRSHQGAGLGLAIVKRLVTLLGGTIALDSDKDRGTAMYVCLPFAHGGALREAPVLPRTFEPRHETATYRILLAEDDPVNAVMASRMLEAMGHSVVTAASGKDALEKLGRGAFDLVVIDIQMPVMDGMEATHAIRNAPPGVLDRNIPIIAMTAHAMVGDREVFMRAGMDGYIAKPVDMQELASVISTVMALGAGQVQ